MSYSADLVDGDFELNPKKLTTNDLEIRNLHGLKATLDTQRKANKSGADWGSNYFSRACLHQNWVTIRQNELLRRQNEELHKQLNQVIGQNAAIINLLQNGTTDLSTPSS